LCNSNFKQVLKKIHCQLLIIIPEKVPFSHFYFEDLKSLLNTTATILSISHFVSADIVYLLIVCANMLAFSTQKQKDNNIFEEKYYFFKIFRSISAK